MDKRAKTGGYLRFSNQEIDTSKTYLNYNLAQDKNQLEFIKNRCGEVRCLNKKDVNVMRSWVVTLPKNLTFGENEKKFFKETYKF